MRDLGGTGFGGSITRCQLAKGLWSEPIFYCRRIPQSYLLLNLFRLPQVVVCCSCFSVTNCCLWSGGSWWHRYLAHSNHMSSYVICWLSIDLKLHYIGGTGGNVLHDWRANMQESYTVTPTTQFTKQGLNNDATTFHIELTTPSKIQNGMIYTIFSGLLSGSPQLRLNGTSFEFGTLNGTHFSFHSNMPVHTSQSYVVTLTRYHNNTWR